MCYTHIVFSVCVLRSCGPDAVYHSYYGDRSLAAASASAGNDGDADGVFFSGRYMYT